MIDALGTPQRILLLGGTSEIGLSIVRRLLPADRATDVVLAGRDPDALALAGQALPPSSARVRTVDFDATDIQGHAATVDAAWDEGDIDIVLVAFGVLGDQDALLKDPAAAAHVTTVNHTGAVSIGLHVADRMRVQGHGHLIAVSSVAAARARPTNFIYGASKAGFDAFFDGLGYSLEPYGVTVSVVRPGFVRTRMTAGLSVPPLASTTSEVSAGAVKRLGHSGARYPSLAHRALHAALRVAPRAIIQRYLR